MEADSVREFAPVQITIDNSIIDDHFIRYTNGRSQVNQIPHWSMGIWTGGTGQPQKAYLKMNVDTYNKLWQDCQKWINR